MIIFTDNHLVSSLKHCSFLVMIIYHLIVHAKFCCSRSNQKLMAFNVWYYLFESYCAVHSSVVMYWIWLYLFCIWGIYSINCSVLCGMWVCLTTKTTDLRRLPCIALLLVFMNSDGFVLYSCIVDVVYHRWVSHVTFIKEKESISKGLSMQVG